MKAHGREIVGKQIGPIYVTVLANHNSGVAGKYQPERFRTLCNRGTTPMLLLASHTFCQKGFTMSQEMIVGRPVLVVIDNQKGAGPPDNPPIPLMGSSATMIANARD